MFKRYLHEKILIIGGVAAALPARQGEKMRRDCDIVLFERGHIFIANCGLPYLSASHQIARRTAFNDARSMREKFAVTYASERSRRNRQGQKNNRRPAVDREPMGIL
jgi:hypothetical protein